MLFTYLYFKTLLNKLVLSECNIKYVVTLLYIFTIKIKQTCKIRIKVIIIWFSTVNIFFGVIFVGMCSIVAQVYIKEKSKLFSA